jgi:hypothetical protein
MKRAKCEAYTAIRGDRGSGEWIDLTSMSETLDGACDAAIVTDKALPDWARDNPFLRVARVEIREISDPLTGAGEG